MSKLTIVGGFYREVCIRPQWNEVYGSGGRGAAAVAQLADVTLVTYAPKQCFADLQDLGERSDFAVQIVESDFMVSFDYMHPLSSPVIRPPVYRMPKNQPIAVSGDVVLRYGMLDGEAVVDAKVAIYDPQSSFGTQLFQANGSKADRLAIILNRYEGAAMVGSRDPDVIVERLLKDHGAEVVVLKMGSHGALVATAKGSEKVPVYRTDYVWKIGSGDVYSATFAALWGIHNLDPAEAADLASRATAAYCNERALSIPSVESLEARQFAPVTPKQGKVYLAGPFFDLGQRWLVEEALIALRDLGVDVFSPVHEVGPGPAELVAPADIKGLEDSDVVLALMNGLDPGTIFEIGYAVKKGIPVVAFAENIKEEDLKMVAGTGCEVVDDFTSAIYKAVWAIA